MRNKLFLAIMTMVILLFSTTISVSAQNTVTPEYKEAINKMMKLSGALAVVDVMVPQMTKAFKPLAPNAPDSFWETFEKTCKTKFLTGMIEIYAPLYVKYFTLDDINELIAFYQTPIGKKLGDVTPKITAEGMQAGQKLGMEIAGDLQKEIEAGGYK